MIKDLKTTKLYTYWTLILKADLFSRSEKKIEYKKINK